MDISQLPWPAAWLEPDGIIRNANEAMCEAFGEQHIAGKNVVEWLNGADAPKMVVALSRMMDGIPSVLEITKANADRRHFIATLAGPSVHGSGPEPMEPRACWLALRRMGPAQFG